MRPSAGPLAALFVATTLILGLTACGAPEAPVPTPTAAPVEVTPVPAPTVRVHAATTQVAEVSTAAVTAFDAPDGAVLAEFANPIASGAPLTFFVESAQDGWVQVRLPMRPNGSLGWIRAADANLRTLDYALRVSTTEHTVTLLRNDVVVDTFPAAVGTGDTPTPLGKFYLTELLAPTNPGYGPYAYGISAFSETLNSFGGGPGQIGLHGTDDADSIGRSVSHGCIRLHNDAITMLAEMLPLGTPITIE